MKAERDALVARVTEAEQRERARDADPFAGVHSWIPIRHRVDELRGDTWWDGAHCAVEAREVLARLDGSQPPEGYIIPEGDERCGYVMDACRCMKRKGHDGLHACAHGLLF